MSHDDTLRALERELQRDGRTLLDWAVELLRRAPAHAVTVTVTDGGNRTFVHHASAELGPVEVVERQGGSRVRLQWTSRGSRDKADTGLETPGAFARILD